MMRFFRWLERKLITGDVIRNYGPVGKYLGIKDPTKVLLLLCKRRGQLQLVFRTSAPVAMSWYTVKVSTDLADKLVEVATDIRGVVPAEAIGAIPRQDIQVGMTAIRGNRDRQPSNGTAITQHGSRFGH